MRVCVIRRDHVVIFSTELYRPRIEGGEAPCVYVQASRGVAVTENDSWGDAGYQQLSSAVKLYCMLL